MDEKKAQDLHKVSWLKIVGRFLLGFYYVCPKIIPFSGIKPVMYLAPVLMIITSLIFGFSEFYRNYDARYIKMKDYPEITAIAVIKKPGSKESRDFMYMDTSDGRRLTVDMSAVTYEDQLAIHNKEVKVRIWKRVLMSLTVGEQILLDFESGKKFSANRYQGNFWYGVLPYFVFLTICNFFFYRKSAKHYALSGQEQE